jgi:hypothetical protein
MLWMFRHESEALSIAVGLVCPGNRSISHHRDARNSACKRGRETEMALWHEASQASIAAIKWILEEVLRNLHLGAEGALPDRGKRSHTHLAAFISWHPRA